MKSSSQFQFAQVPRAEIPRASFKRDHTYKTAFDSGVLVPVYVDEALPGDSFNLKLTSFARLSTPVVPFMDNLYMDFQFFAVPMRLVWDHFQAFMGEQKNPGDSTDYLIPEVESPSAGWAIGSPADYFGIPTGVGKLKSSALYFRAMNLIWNEWYRDENLQDSVTVKTDDGPDDSSLYKNLLPRGKRHDYFTSALPWPQKGPGVELPIGLTAPVYGDGGYMMLQSPSAFVASRMVTDGNKSLSLSGSLISGNVNLATKGLAQTTQQGSSGLYADLSEATGATINSLREAFQLQKYYERAARSGTRYVEILRGMFGVVSPDARLQRPEYLGGGSTPIQIHSVAQTSASNSVTPQGNLAAYGVCGQTGVGFQKSFVEHTIIIGFASVRADLTYQQGLPRMFSRRSKFDFYWPVFAHLGEQAILNKEIYAQGSNVMDSDQNVVDDKVFGYQERWAEYRYGVSKITGKLRSTAAQSLDVWHLSQKFNSLPTLGADFIKENVPLSRVLAVTDEPQIIYDSLITLNCVRPMPMYSVPGMMDHF